MTRCVISWGLACFKLGKACFKLTALDESTNKEDEGHTHRLVFVRQGRKILKNCKRDDY